MDCIISYRVVS